MRYFSSKDSRVRMEFEAKPKKLGFLLQHHEWLGAELYHPFPNTTRLLMRCILRGRSSFTGGGRDFQGLSHQLRINRTTN